MSDLPTPNPTPTTYNYTTGQNIGFWVLWALGLISIGALFLIVFLLLVMGAESNGSTSDSWFVWGIGIAALLQIVFMTLVTIMYFKSTKPAHEVLLWTAGAAIAIPFLSFLGCIGWGTMY